MSVLQSRLNELRYSKRSNLEQEAKVVGNYFRDIIRSYGVDCNYYKLDTSVFGNYKNIVDLNAVLFHAYGYNTMPNYEISAKMLTYMEVENDILNLQRFGILSNTDVNFYFDANDFACALATKAGQFKEYKIEEKEIVCEVPEMTHEIRYVTDKKTGAFVTSSYISAETFPYKLGLGYAETYECGILSGKISVELSSYEEGKEETIICTPYEHTDFKTTFDSNSELYKSFKYAIRNDLYINQLIYLTYKVTKVMSESKKYKFILKGKVHGSILFYDINELGKYIEKIHPQVGDIISIDFPDENNREKYEITDCFDKQLTNDGISPLLHKYVWKCRARRYMNSYENIEENEADERLEEKLKYDSIVKEEVAKKVSFYTDEQDAVYGGYDGTKEKYDKQVPNLDKAYVHEMLKNGEFLDIMRFSIGTRLITNGYDLMYLDVDNDLHIVAKLDHEQTVPDSTFESGLRWLKATKNTITFIDIEGHANILACNRLATQDKLEICLNSLYEKTLDTGDINLNYLNFIKFKGCRSVIWATEKNLYAMLEGNEKLYQLV